jgi:hypothetical protein
VDEERAVTENATARLSFYQRYPTLCLFLCVFIGFPGLGWLWLTLTRPKLKKVDHWAILSLLRNVKYSDKLIEESHQLGYSLYVLHNSHGKKGFLVVSNAGRYPIYYCDVAGQIHGAGRDNANKSPESWPIY